MGKCFFPNGDFYAGGWKNDMMDSTLYRSLNGMARDSILIQNNGLLRYFGQFKENKKHGAGTLYEENIEGEDGPCIKIYKGSYIQDQMNGTFFL